MVMEVFKIEIPGAITEQLHQLTDDVENFVLDAIIRKIELAERHSSISHEILIEGYMARRSEAEKIAEDFDEVD